MTPFRPEIVAPAGTPEKLKTAFHFGADAVYLGLKKYSMRAAAGNFDSDELAWAVEYAHERDKRIYVTLNALPFEKDLPGIEAALGELGRLGVDAVVAGDASVFRMARRVAPEIPIHLSTQLSVTNCEAARFWFEQGARRIIAARELSVHQLGELVRSVPGRFEAFVHGAVCIAYSGRCLLSLYWAGEHRNPQQGACAQACRWQYRDLEETKRPGQRIPVVEDETGTHFFDAKDLCALPLLERLVEAGVHAWKIEGRNRSELYVGLTTDVYRRARDLIVEEGAEAFRSREAVLEAELRRLTSRGLSTHFLSGTQPGREAYNIEGSYGAYGDRFIGKVISAGGEGLVVELKSPVEPDDNLVVRDRGMLEERVHLEWVRLANGEALPSGQPGNHIVIPGVFSAGPGALVLRPA